MKPSLYRNDDGKDPLAPPAIADGETAQPGQSAAEQRRIDYRRGAAATPRDDDRASEHLRIRPGLGFSPSTDAGGAERAYRHRSVQAGFMGFKTVRASVDSCCSLAGANGWCSPIRSGCCLGFALLSNHFEQSKIPVAAKLVPDDWPGGFVLLMIFVLSDPRPPDRSLMGLDAATPCPRCCRAPSWPPCWPRRCPSRPAPC